MVSATVGVCAYNEAGNIERCIRSIYDQVIGADLDSVLVVSSGSTDGTDDIITGLMGSFPTLKLIRQEKREGKNSAVNLLLENNRSDILIMLNADTILLGEDSLSHLIAPFDDPNVGIVGGRPITTNDTSTTAGFASNMLWVLHHHISLISPKIGELIAFRKVDIRLPTDYQSDEDLIKTGLEKMGFIAAYAPEACVLIKGPETVEDLMKQRIRVNVGQMYMKKDHDYVSPSWKLSLIINAVINALGELGPHPILLLRSVLLEMRARNAAKRHVANGGKDDNIWETVESTKKLS